MKTIKSLLVCGLLALTSSAFAQTVDFTFNDVVITPGQTADLNVAFAVDGVEADLAGWQMTLYLPEGIEIATTYDEDEEEDVPAIVLNSSVHKGGHSADVKNTSDGGKLILVSGGTKTVSMKAKSGDLCVITLKALDTFSGSTTATVKKIAVADKNGKQYNAAADASFVVTDDATGINSLNADNSNEPAFNLAGQQVGKNYKGIVVKNGKKTLVK